MTARVLIVDDISVNLRFLKTKLDREYFEVITASSGLEALAAIEHSPPDVVVLDGMMPGMDGFEVCKRIKANPQYGFLPVILLSALDDDEDKRRGLEAGADDFLVKPLDELALYSRLRALSKLKLVMDELNSRENASGVAGDANGMINRGQDISGARVLVLDPDGRDALDVRTALGEVATIDVARSFLELEQLAHRAVHDLVVLPSLVEKADGLRIAARLLSDIQTRSLPIVLIADSFDRNTLNKALQMGISDYVVRPVDSIELSVRCRTQIRRKRMTDALRDNLHLSIKLATTDQVTGLYNRHYMTSQFKTMIAAAEEHRTSLSVAILDLDKFKSVNDTYGHTAGDAVLTEFARRISESLRGVDLVARYGGEEFVVLMPDTPLDIAERIAERLRAATCAKNFPVSGVEGGLPVTVSIGVTALCKDDTGEKDVLNRADEALYDAKHGGRNRVCVYQKSSMSDPVQAAQG